MGPYLLTLLWLNDQDMDYIEAGSTMLCHLVITLGNSHFYRRSNKNLLGRTINKVSNKARALL